VRLVSSGTEAVMSALRLARGATGRPGIVKCDGAYHGHVDALLVAAGSGGETLGVPDSAGVPREAVAHTFVVPYNNVGALETLLAARGGEIAAVILEPVAGNMGCVPPAPGWLEAARDLTQRHGVLLIFDEVMTGFRVARGGAQERYGVRPDLTTLGKIIGGGLPLAAYGGRADLMDQVAPLGPVYQAGTLSGNPVAVAAGLATLRALEAERQAGRDPWVRLEAAGARLEQGWSAAAARADVPVCINRVGSMLTVFFTSGPVTDLRTARAAGRERFARFFHAMLNNGMLLPPSQFEALFLSLAHGEEEIDQAIAAATAAFTSA
jgi:glutamate-1-semialdehyde 2,1-aminomutase